MIGTLIVLLVALTCVRLGFWQLARLEQRKTRNEALVLRSAEFTGRFDDENTIVLANRTLRGVPGVHVFTPLRIKNRAVAVLVNRGWFPAADGTTVNFDSLRTSAADTVIRGLELPFPAARVSRPDTAAGFRRTWFQFDEAKIRGQLPYDLLPYQIQLLPTPGDRSFPIRLKPPEQDNGPHLGYAIQWFSFAVIGIAGWLALVLRRNQKRKREDDASRS